MTLKMAVNIAALVVVVVFYAAIVIMGIIVARTVKVPNTGVSDTEMSMVAGRNIGLFVGIFTMAGKCHPYPEEDVHRGCTNQIPNQIFRH